MRFSTQLSAQFSTQLFTVRPLALPAALLTVMCLLLIGCPEKTTEEPTPDSPPVTHNRADSTSLVPQAHAEPTLRKGIAQEKSSQPKEEKRAKTQRRVKPKLSKILRTQTKREASVTEREAPERERLEKQKGKQKDQPKNQQKQSDSPRRLMPPPMT